MALSSKSPDKVNIKLKELQEACDNTSLKLKNIIKKKQKLGYPEKLDKAIDLLMENPDSMQVALEASKSAPKFFSTLMNKPSIAPGSVVITDGSGEPMKVESINYTTGVVTVTAPGPMFEFLLDMGVGQDHTAPEEPYLVEICSADLQYTSEVGGGGCTQILRFSKT